MKPKTERDLSYIDHLSVEFFQNNGTSSIGVILLTKGWRDRRKEGGGKKTPVTTQFFNVNRY